MIWYTGSPRPIEAWEPGRTWVAFDGEVVPRPLWLTPDIEFARLHAVGKHGVVYEADFTPRRTFPEDDLTFLEGGRWEEPTAYGREVASAIISNEIPLLANMRPEDREAEVMEVLKAIDRRDYGVMETGAVIRWAMDQGFDSIWVRGDGPENLMVLEPERVGLRAA